MNKILVRSNKFEKFNYGAKLLHELLANVQEEFKRFCYRKKVDLIHLFQIRRLDRCNKKLEIVFSG